MEIDRRQCLKALGGGIAVGTLLSNPTLAAVGGRTLYFGAMAFEDGRFGLAAFDALGIPVFEIPLPGRGHGIALSERANLGVVFARRPGDFAVVFRLTDGAVLTEFASCDGRHFYGHGVFCPDDRHLFASENAYDEERGIIGVYAVEENFRRVGEYLSCGIGQHEIALMPDGVTMVIANGGILTHPDTGRAKLNLATMSPSLVYLDARDGRLLGEWRLDARLHQFSIRHLAVGAHGVAFVMQYQGPSSHRVPLIGTHRGQDAPRLLEAPSEVQSRMRNYCGSACLDNTGEILSVPSPRGGITTFWEFASGRFLGCTEIPDGCGVASFGGSGGFLVTSGLGGAVSSGVPDRGPDALPSHYLSERRWDNHLAQGWIPGA